MHYSVGTSLAVIAKQTFLITLQLHLFVWTAGCANEQIWSAAPKVSCFYAAQNTRRLPGLAIIHFFTTITTQSMLIKLQWRAEGGD